MTRTLRNHISPRRILVTVVGAVLGALALALGLLTSSAPAKAAPALASPAGCSVKVLKGNYGGNISGTSTSTGPLALQAIATFNGDGTATADITLMTETSGPTTFTDTITYTLNSDCSGTLTAVRTTGETVHYVITATDNGSKVELMQTDSGFVATGVLDHV
jgi:hypothetical protein